VAKSVVSRPNQVLLP